MQINMEIRAVTHVANTKCYLGFSQGSFQLFLSKQIVTALFLRSAECGLKIILVAIALLHYHMVLKAISPSE